jgi:hypothetical protein
MYIRSTLLQSASPNSVLFVRALGRPTSWFGGADVTSFVAALPEEVQSHLPEGQEASPGVWLVLPAAHGPFEGIDRLNGWLRSQGWYPEALNHVVWFGDDGVGNILGWDPLTVDAVLWNPEDGVPWRRGSVEELWRFVLGGYIDGDASRLT